MEKSEGEFASYISDVANSTMIGHGIVLGKKTGLLKVMMELDVPKTTEEISKIGNFKERYVREWLNLMVCGKVLDYEKSQKTYFLPQYKRHAFTSGSKINMPMFGTVLSFMPIQTDLAKCFALDGPEGVPMSTYEGFAFHHHSHEHDTLTIDQIKNVLSGSPNILTKLEKGASVLEAGCGSGMLAARIAGAFPKSSLHGVDISSEAIALAKTRFTEQGLKNATCDVADLSKMPQVKDSHYDFVFSHFVIHDVPRASAALKEIFRITKPGGAYLMVDFNMHTDVQDNLSNPDAILAYAGSLHFAMPVSLAEEGGEGLGPAWGIEKMQDYFTAARFENVHLPVQPSGQNAFVMGYKPE